MTTTTSRPDPTAGASRYGWIPWLGASLGAAVMGYGVLLVIPKPIRNWPAASAGLVSPESAQQGAVGHAAVLPLFHDFVVVPLVIGAAALAVRLTHAGWCAARAAR